MTDIAKAYVQVIPSAEGISGSLNEIFSGEAGSAGESIGSNLISSIKKTLVAAGIGKVIVDTIKSSINEGGELEQSIGGIETLFGPKGAQSLLEYSSITKKSIGEVKDEYKSLMEGQKLALSNAKDAWKNTGLSANEYMQQISGFAAALNQSLGGDTVASAKAADQAMQDMADNSNKMGTSMEAIQNAYQGFAKQNYTMLDNLKLGYGGTKTEMERLLSDAQKITGVKYDMENLSDVYEAIHVIQGELGITGTTAKEAQKTLQGSAKAMGAAWKDLLGNMAIGGDVEASFSNLTSAASTYLFGNLLPMVGRIVGTLPSVIGKAITKGIPEILASGSDMISSLKDGIVSGIPNVINQGLPLLLQFTGNLRKNFSKLVDSGIDLIMKIADGLIEGMPAIIKNVPLIVSNIAGLINDNAPKIFSAAITLVVKLAQGLWDNRELIFANMKNIVKAIVDVVMAINWLQLGAKVIQLIKSGIQSLFSALPNLLKNIGETAKNLFQNINWIQLGRTIISLLQSGITAVMALIPNLLKTIGINALNFFQNINWTNLGRSVINLISGGISALASIIPNALRSIGNSALSAFSSINWAGMGSSIINGIVSGIRSAGHMIKDTLLGFAQSAWAAAKNFFKIGSPSKLMADTIGKQIPAGVAVGIYSNMGTVEKAMTELGDVTTGSYASELAASKYRLSGDRSAYANSAGASGFTQNITVNAPTELTPSEVARQTRNATKAMILTMKGI